MFGLMKPFSMGLWSLEEELSHSGFYNPFHYRPSVLPNSTYALCPIFPDISLGKRCRVG
uniref:Uncharacterized protein n=1 Tax=Manihot esculenta TaxID=3983 RepID=A0A2C9W2U8_MANES